MPSSEVMRLYREGKLHSGKGGKIVKNRKQARAILLSYLEKEGRVGKCTKKRNGKCVSRKKVTKHH